MINFNKVLILRTILCTVVSVLLFNGPIYPDPVYSSHSLRVPLVNHKIERVEDALDLIEKDDTIERFRSNREKLLIDKRDAMKKFRSDLERLAERGESTVIFFASDSDGFMASYMIIKKLKELTHKAKRKIKVVYSLDFIPKDKEKDVLYIYAIGYQNRNSFSNYYYKNLTHLSKFYRKPNFYMLDLSWDSYKDLEFLTDTFNFWYIDHHELTNALGRFRQYATSFNVINPHCDFNSGKIADIYTVAAIVYDIIGSDPEFELSPSVTSDVYKPLLSIYNLQLNRKNHSIAAFINDLDLVTMQRSKKARINRCIMSSLMNSHSVDELYDKLIRYNTYDEAKKIKRDISKNIKNILNISLTGQNKPKFIIYELDSRLEYGLVSPTFKRLREFFKRDSYLSRVVILIYQRMDGNVTYFRSGAGDYFSGDIDLALIFNGDGVYKVRKFGGGHWNRAGGYSFSNTHIPQEEQETELKVRVYNATGRIELKNIGLFATLKYIRESINNQMLTNIDKNSKVYIFIDYCDEIHSLSKSRVSL